MTERTLLPGDKEEETEVLLSPTLAGMLVVRRLLSIVEIIIFFVEEGGRVSDELFERLRISSR
jgi:hypothetical protein